MSDRDINNRIEDMKRLSSEQMEVGERIDELKRSLPDYNEYKENDQLSPSKVVQDLVKNDNEKWRDMEILNEGIRNAESSNQKELYCSFELFALEKDINFDISTVKTLKDHFEQGPNYDSSVEILEELENRKREVQTLHLDQNNPDPDNPNQDSSNQGNPNQGNPNQNSSLLDEYADTSVEMTDYTGGDD